ncbi:MAG: hypothetical protein Q7S28_01790 [bacterium]|nr:hypothetical protein [bacterium]
MAKEIKMQGRVVHKYYEPGRSMDGIPPMEYHIPAKWIFEVHIDGEYEYDEWRNKKLTEFPILTTFRVSRDLYNSIAINEKVWVLCCRDLISTLFGKGYVPSYVIGKII